MNMAREGERGGLLISYSLLKTIGVGGGELTYVLR